MNHYVIGICDLSPSSHNVNQSSIISHVNFKSHLSTDKKKIFLNVGTIGYAILQSKRHLFGYFSSYLRLKYNLSSGEES